MKKTEFKLKSSDGINTLAGYKYDTTCTFLKGVVVILHGMKEYLFRYEPFIEYLNDKGYAVVGFDQLGHGFTAKTTEDLGYYGPGKTEEYLVRDTKLIVDQSKIWFDGVPVILLGHSQGSSIGRLFIEKYPLAINGFIMMGSLGPDRPFTNLINSMLLKILILLQGEKGRNKGLDKFAFKAYIKRIKNPVNASAWLSRDEKICRAYAADPFCNYVFTFKGFQDILRIRSYINSDLWFNNLNSKLPIFIVSGAEDPCGDYGQAISKIHEKLVGKIEDLTLKLYPEDRHEILNELDRAEVYQDIENWLNERCQKNFYQVKAAK